ncbi:MAG: hypothetical protein K2H53_07335 [Clostridia bacterium]|nr:hypothetical protein [Clostridia bacterium]
MKKKLFLKRLKGNLPYSIFVIVLITIYISLRYNSVKYTVIAVILITIITTIVNGIVPTNKELRRFKKRKCIKNQER